MTKLLACALMFAVVLLLVTPTLSYAITPAQHKCIQDKLNTASGSIGAMILINTSQDAATTAAQQIRNLTSDIESCIQ